MVEYVCDLCSVSRSYCYAHVTLCIVVDAIYILNTLYICYSVVLLPFYMNIFIFIKFFFFSDDRIVCAIMFSFEIELKDAVGADEREKKVRGKTMFSGTIKKAQTVSYKNIGVEEIKLAETK